MSTGKTVSIITLLAGIAAIAAGVLGYRYLYPTPRPTQPPSLIPEATQILDKLPEFALPGLDGRPNQSSKWVGKVLILNFWATWCPPCLREMPAFIELQQELGGKGLQFVGIAIDSPEAVREFVDARAVNYPILIGEEDAIELSRRLGNRMQGLPYSAIFDRAGRLVYSQAGELKPEAIREQIKGLL